MPLTKAAFNPQCQPYVDAITSHLKQNGLTIAEFCATVWGRDAKGKVKGTGALYPFLKGTSCPGPTTLARIKEKTGLDMTGIPRPGNATQTTARALAAVEAYHLAAKPVPGVKPTPRQPYAEDAHVPPRFALSIGQDGRAQVMLNMRDVSADDAMQVFGLLNTANLLKPRTEGDA